MKTQSKTGTEVEGNNGGTFVRVTQEGRDTIRIEVGHECVHRVDKTMNVFRFARLLMAAFDEKDGL